MKNKIYCLYNTLSKRYDNVIAYPSDSFALARIQNQIGDLKEWELCRIGEIDIETGIIQTDDVIRIAWTEKTENLPTRETNQEETQKN